MIWLDFLLQVYVHALGWCLAVVTTAGLVMGGLWLAIRLPAWLPFGGRRP